MSDFKVIETQEQLDAIIKDRLERAEKKQAEKYAGYLSPEEVDAKMAELNKQVEDLGNSLTGANDKAKTDAEAIAGLEAKVKNYETASVKSRIAHEVGIPYELANKLSGDTEEDIRKDAEALKPFVTKHQTAPLRDPEAGEAKSSTREKFAEWAKENIGG
jgi:hypothetical protein